MTRKFPLYILLCLAIALGAVSCNKDEKKSNDTIEESYSQSTTLIKTFALVADDSVMANLDSVQFTIDLDKAEIYNADSLPVGTDVSHLCVDLTFSSAVSEAEFQITGAKNHRDTTFSYMSKTDSIDFTGDVKFKVTSYDGTLTRYYKIKVNVHQVKPDSLYWSQFEKRTLPNTPEGSSLVDEKTVKYGDKYMNYVTRYENGDTTYYLSTAASAAQGAWAGEKVNFPVKPNVRSITAASGCLYMLAGNGTLCKSADGRSWSSCGVQWTSISGYCGDRALGVLRSGDAYKHDEYPRRQGFVPTELEDQFPVMDASPMVYANNGWSDNPQGMIAGGLMKDMTPTNAVWGYDGEIWGQINNVSSASTLPKLMSPVLFPYYTVDVNSKTFKATRYVTWVVMGGRLADGTLNTTVYTSRDQGILWKKGESYMQQPAYMPGFYGAEAFVETSTLTDSQSASAGVWKKTPAVTLPAWIYPMAPVRKLTANHKNMRRASATGIDSWDCPYVYLFGGINQSGQLLNSVWKGAINRFTFKPLY